MKKLLGILVLSLLWCNIAASEEMLIDPREADATYGCKLEDGKDEKQRIIYVVKQLPNDNFLVNFWAPRLGRKEWFNAIRMAHLNEGKLEWFEHATQKELASSGRVVTDEYSVLLNITFYFSDEALKNGKQALEITGIRLRPPLYYDIKFKSLLKKANKAKHSDMGGEKHIRLEKKYFESALKTKEKQSTYDYNLLGKSFYYCELWE